MAALAARIGVSRSKLIRAAFLAIEHEDAQLIRARLANLPPDGRATWKQKEQAAG